MKTETILEREEYSKEHEDIIKSLNEDLNKDFQLTEEQLNKLNNEEEVNMQKYTLDDVVEKLDKIIKLLEYGNSGECLDNTMKMYFEASQEYLEKKNSRRLYEDYPSPIPLNPTDKIIEIDPSRGYRTIPNIPNGTYLIPNGYHAEHIFNPSKFTCTTTIASPNFTSSCDDFKEDK